MMVVAILANAIPGNDDSPGGTDAGPGDVGASTLTTSRIVVGEKGKKQGAGLLTGGCTQDPGEAVSLRDNRGVQERTHRAKR